MDVNKLEEHLDIRFHDKDLLIQAFTHSSYANEYRHDDFRDNERLEFLGDAVLELAVSEYLFSTYKDVPEGHLTKLRAQIVCEPSLYHFAKKMNFGDFLRLGKGEEQSGGRERPAILADCFEAFLGALYIDKGLEDVNKFLETYVFPHIQVGAFSHGMDYKSKLQELVQKKKNHQITYEVIGEFGPPHHKEFHVQVTVNGKALGQGIGHSKKEAEQHAAKIALDQLKKQNERT